ncbi:AraC family transcriptional regulator [Niabella aquatica]
MRTIINEHLTISKISPLKARHFDYKYFTYPWHFHPEYEIIYIKKGAGTRFIGNNIDKYNDGDSMLMGSNLPHYMKSDDIYSSEDNNLRVNGSIIQFEKDFMYYSVNHYPHLRKIKKLLEKAQHGIYFPAGSSAKMKELLESIPKKKGLEQFMSFLQLLQAMAENQFKRIISHSNFAEKAASDSSRIDMVLSYLNSHYTQPISLKEVASFAAMNNSAFCRFFKTKTGKSFKSYLMDMRIDYACKLLLLDEKNIYQISTECGFDTISHFNKTFKNKLGYPPSEYRKTMM